MQVLKGLLNQLVNVQSTCTAVHTCSVSTVQNKKMVIASFLKNRLHVID